jgi:hypothetical protein
MLPVLLLYFPPKLIGAVVSNMTAPVLFHMAYDG